MVRLEKKTSYIHCSLILKNENTVESLECVGAQIMWISLVPLTNELISQTNYETVLIHYMHYRYIQEIISEQTFKKLSIHKN